MISLEKLIEMIHPFRHIHKQWNEKIAHPAARIFRYKLSTFLLVSAKIIVLFSSSLPICSSKSINLREKIFTIKNQKRWPKFQITFQDAYLFSFSSSSQISTCCLILWFAAKVKEPTFNCMYFRCKKSSAKVRTSLGQVADHISTCLSGWTKILF